MTTNHRRRTLGLAVLASCATAACSGSNDVAEITSVPPSSAAVSTTEAVGDTTAIETTATDTVVVVTTEAVASTVGESGLTGPMFSDALGVKVATAPGVNTAGDTRQLLPEGLYVHLAWESDPNDPSVFTVQPDDIEILEAYTNAVRAFYKAATTDLVVDPLAFEPYMIDAGGQFEISLGAARAGGFVDTLGDGVLLRPYVLADRRSEGSAVVLDCTVSDEAFVVRSDPNRAQSEPVQRGQLATMVFSDGEWKVEAFAEETAACL